MQDRTIDNALIALAKLGGDQAIAAKLLLDMRGVDYSARTAYRPMKRRKSRQLVLDRLAQGPCTIGDVAEAFAQEIGGVTKDHTWHRAYMALKRLEKVGRVVQDFGPEGCLWRVAPVKGQP